jgi:hypothetical protein
MADYSQLIESAAKRYRVPAGPLLAMANIESNGNPSAVNKETGATGLFQFLPATAKAYDIDPTDPAQSADAAARMFRDNLQRFGGNVDAAVAAHHGGTDPANWGPKTVAYVNNVSNSQANQEPDSGPIDDLDRLLQARASGKSVAGSQAGAAASAQPQGDSLDAMLAARAAGKAAQPPAQPTIQGAQPAPQPAQPPQPSAAEPPPETGDPWLDMPYVGSYLKGAMHNWGSMVNGIEDIAGKGLETIGAQRAGGYLRQDAAQSQAPLDQSYQEARAYEPVSATAGELYGGATNPINLALPGGGEAAGTLRGAMTTGALQGGIVGGLSAPITPQQEQGNSWTWLKAQQVIAGAMGGAAAAGLVHSVSGALNYAVNRVRGVLSSAQGSVNAATGANAQGAAQAVDDALKTNGIDPAAVPPDFLATMRQKAQEALDTGKDVDPKTMQNLLEAASLPVPVPMLKGQASRNPAQFTDEQNISGVRGAGEPIQNVINAQNAALMANLDAMGAKNAPDVVDGGQSLVSSIQRTDQEMRQGVTNAYTAFRAATGKDLDVPMQGLAQDYTRILDNFGDVIPAAVRKQFDAYGLQSGTQFRTFTIEDAENLIRNINLHYDPQNLAQARALDQLRSSVQRSITEGAGAAAMNDFSPAGKEAAQLALAARSAAAQRFQLIDRIPLYKAVVNGEAPDKLIQKYVLSGNAGDIRATMALLQQTDPAAADTVRSSVMDWLKGKASNGGTGDNALFSQPGFSRVLNDPNYSARLQEVLGPERMAQLQTLGRVAENIKVAPAGATVNTSRTASGLVNFQTLQQPTPMSSMLKIGAAGVQHVPIVGPTIGAVMHGGAEEVQNQAMQRKISSFLNEATQPGVASSWTPRQQGDLVQLSDLLKRGAASAAASHFGRQVELSKRASSSANAAGD